MSFNQNAKNESMGEMDGGGRQTEGKMDEKEKMDEKGEIDGGRRGK